MVQFNHLKNDWAKRKISKCLTPVNVITEILIFRHFSLIFTFSS